MERGSKCSRFKIKAKFTTCLLCFSLKEVRVKILKSQVNKDYIFVYVRQP